MPLTSLIYLSMFPLLPLMALQGRRVRATTPDVPPAAGPPTGQTSESNPSFRLLVLGESTAAGVGAQDHESAIAGPLARAIAQHTGHVVSWHVEGRNGATARDVRQDLLPLVPNHPIDLVVILLGVNDTKNLIPVATWEQDLHDLFSALRQRLGSARFLVSGVPPLGHFPALPHPLRHFMGLRASLMDAALRGVVEATDGAMYGGPVSAPHPDMFCPDRFHPGPMGYAMWAEGMASVVLPTLGDDVLSSTRA